MSYHTVSPERIAELRKLADSLKDNQELSVLSVLFGARSMQGMDQDLLSCKEVTPDELPQGRECLVRAAEYIHDTICRDEMLAVIDANDLGDYGLKVKLDIKVEVVESVVSTI